MKRYLILLAAAFIMVSVSRPAFSVGTATDWSVKMQFKMGTTEDVLDLTIGTASAAADEELKPPALPGKVITGDDTNAYVRAALLNATGRPAASKLIGLENKNVYPIEIEAENAEMVSVTLTESAEFYAPYYPIVFIIPGETNPLVQLNYGETAKDLFLSDGSARTIFALAGDSKNVAIASADEDKVFGWVQIPKKGFVEGTVVNLYDASCNSLGTTTTDATGKFSFDTPTDGDYIAQVDKDYFVTGDCDSVTLGTGYTAASCPVLSPGDFNNDGKVNFVDLKILKDVFGKKSTDTDWVSSGASAIEYNGDNQVNFLEVQAIKTGFNLKDEKVCGE